MNVEGLWSLWNQNLKKRSWTMAIILYQRPWKSWFPLTMSTSTFKTTAIKSFTIVPKDWLENASSFEDQDLLKRFVPCFTNLLSISSILQILIQSHTYNLFLPRDSEFWWLPPFFWSLPARKEMGQSKVSPKQPSMRLQAIVHNATNGEQCDLSFHHGTDGFLPWRLWINLISWSRPTKHNWVTIQSSIAVFGRGRGNLRQARPLT